MNDWYRVLTIGLYVDRALILFPEYTRSFCMPVETAPEHPSLLSLVLLDDTGWIPLLSRPPSYPGTRMPPSCNPGFVCPQYLIPLIKSPVNVLHRLFVP